MFWHAQREVGNRQCLVGGADAVVVVVASIATQEFGGETAEQFLLLVLRGGIAGVAPVPEPMFDIVEQWFAPCPFLYWAFPAKLGLAASCGGYGLDQQFVWGRMVAVEELQLLGGVAVVALAQAGLERAKASECSV